MEDELIDDEINNPQHVDLDKIEDEILEYIK